MARNSGPAVLVALLALGSASCSGATTGSGRLAAPTSTSTQSAPGTGGAGSGVPGSGGPGAGGPSPSRSDPSTGSTAPAGPSPTAEPRAGRVFCRFTTAARLRAVLGGDYRVTDFGVTRCGWEMSPKRKQDNSGAVSWSTFGSVTGDAARYRDGARTVPVTVDGHPGVLLVKPRTGFSAGSTYLFVSTGRSVTADGEVSANVADDGPAAGRVLTALVSEGLRYAALQPG